MEYDDFVCPTPDEYEVLAKAYSDSLKEKGFIFVRLDNEGVNILIDEVFDLMFKLRASYRAIGNFMGCDKFYSLNEEQIDLLRSKFSYKQNRGFKVNWNKTKCFLNAISLENRLLIKLFLLAQKSDEYEFLVGLIFQRMRLSADLFEIGDVMTVSLNNLN